MKPALAASAPNAEQLGLSPQQFLNLGGAGEATGDITSPHLPSQVLGFVAQQLRSQQIDMVVVFGGPPCTMYSMAWVDSRAKLWEAVKAAEATLEKARVDKKAAGERLAGQLQAAAAGQPDAFSPALAVMLSSADKCKLLETELQKAELDQQSAVAAAEKAVQQLDKKFQDSDDMVKAFLNLYQCFKAVCEAEHGVRCCLFMENPESTAVRGLWTRCALRDTRGAEMQQW
eukprot:GHRQ01020328.1.p1 GENE.GHRQ01020328.1~~GHRQ01020328.1.p1  ORF type:complete len:230 (+),score=64.00 GHRQ01020328.1:265-954(+)